MPALFGQVLALLELLSSEIAGNQRMAVGADPVCEVLAGHTDTVALPSRQLSVVNKGPLLHLLVLQ